MLTRKIELLDVGRYGFAVRKINSDVYIFGGCIGDDNTASCEIFNLETEEIRKGGNLPDSNSDQDLTACGVWIRTF